MLVCGSEGGDGAFEIDTDCSVDEGAVEISMEGVAFGNPANRAGLIVGGAGKGGMDGS